MHIALNALTAKPTAAFIFSLIGGIITLSFALLTINTWFFLSSTVGGFAYSSPFLNEIPSGQALALFIIAAISGFLIIVGAVLQYSGRKSSVRLGSIIALAAIILAAPGTFFGGVFGGLLATMGVILGLIWKGPSQMTGANTPG